VAAHLNAHPAGSRRAVLGWCGPTRARDAAFGASMRRPGAPGRRGDGGAMDEGINLYTGNVSFRRETTWRGWA
jgi:hypothetical protein